MARLACVNLPGLPLQLLLRRHPHWRGQAVAVVPDQKIQSRILWCNAAARGRGVRTGMPYAAALSLAESLRAGVVPPAEVAAGMRALTTRLQRFSPHVEPSREEPGVFWLDATGLEKLHPSPRAWVERVHADLSQAGFAVAVAAGFTRFGGYAAAKALPGARAFADAGAERRMVLGAPLKLLGLAPGLRDALLQLGIVTVRDLLALPAGGLLERFGPPAYRLHCFAAGVLGEPLQPAAEPHPVRERIVLEYPEADTARLLFLIKGPFHALLSALTARRQSLKALHFRFLLEGEAPWETAVRPAAPTRDVLLLMDLVRLRLERLRLVAGVTGIEMLAEGTASEVEQLSLFADAGGRDLAAGERALARLRAEFGEGAVVRAVLREGHLPTARFAWQPLARLRVPAPHLPQARRLVRRVFARPPLLFPQPGGDDAAALARAVGSTAGGTVGNTAGNAVANTVASTVANAVEDGPARRVQGPYLISGGWWAGGQQREYYFAESGRGELLWVYHDRRRERWYQQGRVE